MKLRDQRGNALINHPKFAIFCGSVFKGRVKHLSKSSVIAAMFKIWKKAGNESLPFWLAVRDGNDLSRLDPRKSLREFLFDSIGTHNLEKGKFIYCRCITSWNAWRDGREVKWTRGMYEGGEVPEPH